MYDLVNNFLSIPAQGEERYVTYCAVVLTVVIVVGFVSGIVAIIKKL